MELGLNATQAFSGRSSHLSPQGHELSQFTELSNQQQPKKLLQVSQPTRLRNMWAHSDHSDHISPFAKEETLAFTELYMKKLKF